MPRQGGSCYSCYCCYFTLLRIVTCSCKLDPWRPCPNDLSLLAGFRGTHDLRKSEMTGPAGAAVLVRWANWVVEHDLLRRPSEGSTTLRPPAAIMEPHSCCGTLELGRYGSEHSEVGRQHPPTDWRLTGRRAAASSILFTCTQGAFATP